MDTRVTYTEFSEDYGHLRALRSAVAEDAAPFQEDVLQCVWYDQVFVEKGLHSDDGRTLRILSPGWWNHSEGPDFQGAQIEFNGKVKTGDVEIHLTHAAWRQHGHHLDPRYDGVMLVVVLESEPPKQRPTTSSGRPIPCLLLGDFIEGDLESLAGRLSTDDYPYEAQGAFGDCAELVKCCGSERIETLVRLAGEWRMIAKAQGLRERIDRVGPEQALYEAFLSACGFHRYRHPFRVVAQQLPYDRVRQLARRDPLLVEAAFLQVAGLLPDGLPEGSAASAHFDRLSALRREHLPGLKRLPIEWRRLDVRPTNYPERRLAGAAKMLSLTARDGLLDSLERIWHEDTPAAKRRRAFEELFPIPAGGWADRCTWTGKTLRHPVALLGPSRVRGILGNVFVPMALALARRVRDRQREERVFEFFAKLPAEPDNHVLKIMVPRIFGEAKAPKLDFRMQQGLLQLFYDFCEPNPSCRGCSVVPYAAVESPGE